MLKKLRHFLLSASMVLISVSCEIDPHTPVSTPEIESLNVDEISYYSFVISGKIKRSGSRGFHCVLHLTSTEPELVKFTADEDGSFTLHFSDKPSNTRFQASLELLAGRQSIVSDAISFCTKKEIVEFECKEFKDFCVTNFDSDGDGDISFSEAGKVESIMLPDNSGISSLRGIEHFTSLKELFCNHGRLQGTVDLRENTSLNYLALAMNDLDEILLTPSEHMGWLVIIGNPIHSFDISRFPNLTWFDASDTPLTELDTSCNPYLSALYISRTRIKSLNLENQAYLHTLNVSYSELSTLDVSTCAMDGYPLDLYCSASIHGMNTLYIREGQIIPNVTENRSNEHISPWTEIVVR